MARIGTSSLCLLTALCVSRLAGAVSSAEMYTGSAYGYGRAEARLKFAAGDGVVSSFFLWKDGSEVAGTFWNELDFEKVGADCHVETNAIYGNPSASHAQVNTPVAKPCDTYHTYAYEWTPEAIRWLVDDVEVRREAGATAAAFAENAAGGMQIHFNVWPGDATFGGNFSPSILPIHQYVDWVQFSSYQGGTFALSWREDFEGAGLPSEFLTGSWGSPKNLSTHDPRNVNFLDGHLVLSLTADSAVGPVGAMPNDPGGGGSPTGAAGSASTAGTSSSGGTSSAAGAPATGGAAGTLGAAGAPGAAGTLGAAGAPGAAGTLGAAGASSSPGTSPPVAAPRDSGGCSVARYRGTDLSLLLAVLAAAAISQRRRRRRTPSNASSPAGR